MFTPAIEDQRKNVNKKKHGEKKKNNERAKRNNIPGNKISTLQNCHHAYVLFIFLKKFGLKNSMGSISIFNQSIN